MKRIIAIISIFSALVLVGTREVSTQGSFALEELIHVESKSVNVPVQLVHAVIRTESRGNPLAESKTGCRGLMQISEEVWNIFMKGESWNLAYDPQENVRCGIRYLGDLYQMYFSWEKVLRHYHSGDPYSKREVTNRYVTDVLRRAGMVGEIALR